MVLLHLPPTKRLLRPIVSSTLSWVSGRIGRARRPGLCPVAGRAQTLRSPHCSRPDETSLSSSRRSERSCAYRPSVMFACVSIPPSSRSFSKRTPTVTSRSSFLARWDPLTLLRVELANGTLRVLSPADELWFEIRSVELNLEWLLDHYRAQVNATDGTLDSDSAEILFGPLEGVFEMRGSELRIVSSQSRKRRLSRRMERYGYFPGSLPRPFRRRFPGGCGNPS